MVGSLVKHTRDCSFMQHAFDVPQLDAEDKLGISHNKKAREKLLFKLTRVFGCIVF